MMKYLNSFFLFFLLSCTGRDKVKSDFVGIWDSDDGSTIILHADGTATLKRLNLSNFFDDKIANSRISANGYWELSEDRYKKNVVGISAGGHRIKFFVGGSGLLEISPPWRLYCYIGDPDEMNRYIFLRSDNEK